MRRRDDGWDNGRRDGWSDDGWRDEPAGPGSGYGNAGHGAGRNADGYGYGTGYNDGGSNGQNQGYGRQDYRDYPDPGRRREPSGPGRPSYGGGGASEATQLDLGRADSGYNGGGSPRGGNGQQPNFAPGRSNAPSEFSPGDAPAAGQARTPRPYGRLSIYTLLDDKAAEFDALAEEAAEGVRTSEPDTLVYVIHVVPKAPLQRIMYEIYRDRGAFEVHENQPHIQRFNEARKACVLATNIIDLRLKYAKVAALFTGDPSGAPADQDSPMADRDSRQRRTPRALEAGARPAGADGYARGEHGGQYGSGGHGPDRYGNDRYGPDRSGADQHGGEQRGAGRYGAGQYGAGQYGANQDRGGDQYAGGAGGGHRAGQYGQSGQYEQSGRYEPNAQYSGGGPYNGAAQSGGDGRRQQYGGGNGGYRGALDPAPGPEPRDSQKARGRPPWDEKTDWSTAPRSIERYGG
ncbi:MAG TPA: antibiotic biosynthesis monooxygenase [Trebonia sp.]